MGIHRYSLPDPETLDPPDVGFIAAVGVYVATVLVGAAVSIALAVGATAFTVVSSISSAVTIGLIVGAIGARRTPGLAERLGYSRRLRGLLFAVPALFGLATIGALFAATIPAVTAVGTGLGVVGTGLAAAGIASMAQTRYARAMVSDEPVAQFPWRKPNQGRSWILVGVGCIAVGLVLTIGTDGFLQPGFWWLFVYGLISVFAGLSHRRRAEDREEGAGWSPRRRILGSEWARAIDAGPDTEMLPELSVHENGIVRKGPMQRRFVPWTDVTAVRLTEDELAFERDGWFDIRCDRSEIDDPEAVYEEIRRVRSEGEISAD